MNALTTGRAPSGRSAGPAGSSYNLSYNLLPPLEYSS